MAVAALIRLIRVLALHQVVRLLSYIYICIYIFFSIVFGVLFRFSVLILTRVSDLVITMSDLKPQIPMSTPSSIPVSYGGYQGSSKKIDIPNGRVGVIIGKGGETIKYLQLQSGAKIQVTRDMDADLNSPTRMVELMGTPEQIAKAEQLINDVLAGVPFSFLNEILVTFFFFFFPLMNS